MTEFDKSRFQNVVVTKNILLGHGCSLQIIVSVAFPWHSFPPFVAILYTDLERDIWPFPQLFEHEDQAS